MKIVVSRRDIIREPYKASGPGGQHRNKTETAIRLRHAPSGVVAQCASERSQRQNYESALAMLLSRIVLMFRDRADAERAAAYQAKPDASFGHQVRTYWRVGHRRVVDHRTGVEGDPEDVVRRGKLDEFIRAGVMARWQG